MEYDIRLVKLVTGEMVVAKFNAETNAFDDPAIIQAVPTQTGTSMVLLPYGYPFDQEMHGTIAKAHVMFEYKSCPEEVKTRYLEATTNIKLSSGGLGGLDLTGGSGGLNLG